MVRINFWARESGATAVEYCLFVALIAGVIFATVATFGQSVLALFTYGRIAEIIGAAS